MRLAAARPRAPLEPEDHFFDGRRWAACSPWAPLPLPSLSPVPIRDSGSGTRHDYLRRASWGSLRLPWCQSPSMPALLRLERWSRRALRMSHPHRGSVLHATQLRAPWRGCAPCVAYVRLTGCFPFRAGFGSAADTHAHGRPRPARILVTMVLLSLFGQPTYNSRFVRTAYAVP